MAAPTRREHARARRTLGQNFLADPGRARRLAELAVPEPGTLVYEVGAGRAGPPPMLTWRDKPENCFPPPVCS